MSLRAAPSSPPVFRVVLVIVASGRRRRMQAFLCGRRKAAGLTETPTMSSDANHDGAEASGQGQPEASAPEGSEEIRVQRIRNSALYFEVPKSKVPLVYSPKYNIGFMGLEKLHPFDSGKWGNIWNILVQEKKIAAERFIEPAEATSDDLRVVHEQPYLTSLERSRTVARIIEVAPVAMLPNFIVQRQVLQPFRKQVGGTVLAGKLAKERGWAINLGGGFHHCSAERGGGFCVYADITLCIQFAFSQPGISRAMIIDLDAHQGNGHERDFFGDDRVYILDMYNSQIYPFDVEAKKKINQMVELKTGTTTDEYLELLDAELKKAKDAFVPDLIIYNAGTDILKDDPLGRLCVTAEGVTTRDEKVFTFARGAWNKPVPIVMVTSGGYMMKSARVIADSIANLLEKNIISID